MRTIIVTGAGGAPALNFVMSMRLADMAVRFVGVDADKYHLALAPTEERHLVPRASEADYLPVLQSIIESTRADFLFAQPDPEVAVISENRERLSVTLCLPAKPTVRICQDKYATHQIWQKAGIKQPATILAGDEAAVETFFARHNPVWLRPLTGAAGRGALLSRSAVEAIHWLNLNKGWGRYTAAEYLSPDSVTWQSLWNDGRLIAAQGRRRLYWEYSDRTMSGVTGITGGAMTTTDSQVDAIALEAIAAVDSRPHGIFSVDLTYDRDGVPNPTEINIGRFFTTQLFFSQAGFNMPAMMVRMALGEDEYAGNPIINPLEPGLIWLRGMDRAPVLTTAAEIDAYEEELKRIRRHAGQETRA